MARIGLVARDNTPPALDLARRLTEWAAGRGHVVLADGPTGRALGLPGEAYSNEALAAAADPIVTLGGDGTLIGVARYVTDPRTTLIGVNFGTLGFLTEIAPEELLDVLDAHFSGRADYGLRPRLGVEVVRAGQGTFFSRAVNDAVVQKGTQDPLVELDFWVGDEPVARVRADGLIVATATGSTAYSLAAGGSIVYPNLPAVLVTPICAHSLTSRPIVLPLDSLLMVRLPRYGGRVYLSVDGQVSVALIPGDEIRFTKGDHPVRFVRSPSKSYFEILRTKLNWGMPNQSGTV